MAKKGKLSWSDAPAAQDYPAAGSYLRLLALPGTVEVLASMLSQAPTVTQAAKDILRAAGLPLLPVDDPEVAKDVKKVAKGQPLSPVLLVRGDLAAGRLLQIADGYHRVCASYHLNQDTEIPCRIANIPAATG
jgi:hypothetical protein